MTLFNSFELFFGPFLDQFIPFLTPYAAAGIVIYNYNNYYYNLTTLITIITIITFDYILQLLMQLNITSRTQTHLKSAVRGLKVRNGATEVSRQSR